ncbi:MAG: TolC family protein [Pirellulaceae bacterium]
MRSTRPFVPSVLLGFSTGSFGGGLGNNSNNFGGRYDLDALMTWQYRNLGFGEQAARRQTAARIQQAKFEQLRVMDQVALDVSESYSQVQFRRQQIETTQRAIKSAEASYNRNLERIRDGQGLPIEVLQSVQALESTRRAYLNAVIAYNQAQFRLQWALGWPVSEMRSARES